MPTATIQAYVESAVSLKSKSSSTYLAIGKTSAWENESVPPMPEEDVTELEEIIGYKKMTTVSLCRPLRGGETSNYTKIYYNNQTWLLIPDAQAQNEEAYYVYYAVTLEGKDLPTGEYRQVGVHTGLTASVSTSVVLPSQVTTKGTLQFYDNRQQFNRTEKVAITEKFIVSMKGE